MRIKLVNQECGQSCGIACVAMVTGKPFANIRQQVTHVPISQRTMEHLLTDNGVRFNKPVYDDLLPDRVYIMAVPSLNKSGSMHYVVADTRGVLDIYDPLNHGEDGGDFYTPSKLISWGRLLEIEI